MKNFISKIELFGLRASVEYLKPPSRTLGDHNLIVFVVTEFYVVPKKSMILVTALNSGLAPPYLTNVPCRVSRLAFLAEGDIPQKSILHSGHLANVSDFVVALLPQLLGVDGDLQVLFLAVHHFY